MKRLAAKHPTREKVEKLVDLALQLGIHIEFHGSNTVIADKDFPGNTYYLADPDDNTGVASFPPAVDYVILKKE